MPKQGLDRRVTRTRANIRKSITQLLSEKPANEITVREISDGADINRATFYLHYKDVYDLIHRIENDMYVQFYTIVNSHSAEEFALNPMPMLTDIFTFLQENADMCKALLSPSADRVFVDKLKNVLWEKCEADWIKLYKVYSSDIIKPYISFTVSGCMGLLEQWINQDMEQSVEEISRIAGNLIQQGLSSLGTVSR